MTDLKGYIALITGGSSGIGFEMAKQLLTQGATVIIAAREGRKLDRAREDLIGAGKRVCHGMDVTDEGSVARAAEWVKGKFGRLDMVVNNAGIGANAPGMEDLPSDHAFYQIPLQAVRAVIETNLTGYFNRRKPVRPADAQAGTRQSGLCFHQHQDHDRSRADPLRPPPKPGRRAMTAIIAKELEGAGIMVNVICPGGFTDTNMAPKGAKAYFFKQPSAGLAADHSK